MQLENQVCSLEQAKELKDLGVDQDSLFYWNSVQYPFVTALEVHYGKSDTETITAFSVMTSLASAFTVAELGVMLSNG